MLGMVACAAGTLNPLLVLLPISWLPAKGTSKEVCGLGGR